MVEWTLLRFRFSSQGMKRLMPWFRVFGRFADLRASDHSVSEHKAGLADAFGVGPGAPHVLLLNPHLIYGQTLQSYVRWTLTLVCDLRCYFLFSV